WVRSWLRGHLVMEPEHGDAEEAHQVIAPEDALIVGVDGEAFAERPQIPDLEPALVEREHAIKPRIAEALALGVEAEAAVPEDGLEHDGGVAARQREDHLHAARGVTGWLLGRVKAGIDHAPDPRDAAEPARVDRLASLVAQGDHLAGHASRKL